MSAFLERQHSDLASLAELVAQRGKKEQLLLPPRTRPFFMPEPETFDLEQREFYRNQFGLRKERNVMPSNSWLKALEEDREDKTRQIPFDNVRPLEPRYSGGRIGALVPLLCAWDKGLIRLYEWRAQTTVEKVKRFALTNIQGTSKVKTPPKTFENTQLVLLRKGPNGLREEYVKEADDYVFDDPPSALLVVPRHFTLIIRQRVHNTYNQYELTDISAAWSVFQLKVHLANRLGLSAYWTDLVYNGKCLLNEQRVFLVVGLEDQSVIHVQVQHGFPIPIEVHTFWGRRYKAPVYATTNVRELLTSIFVQCFSQHADRKHLTQQLVDSGSFDIKINDEVWSGTSLIYHPVHRVARSIAAGSLESEAELLHEKASGQLIGPREGISLLNAIQVSIQNTRCFGGSEQYALARVHRYDVQSRDTLQADYLEVKLRVAVDKWAVVAMYVHGETGMPLDSFALVWNGVMLSYYDVPHDAVVYDVQIRPSLNRSSYNAALVSPKNVKLKVRSICGLDAELWVNEFDKIANVMRELRSVGYFETDYAQLWFNDRLCDPDSSVRSCGMTYESMPCLLFITIPVRLARFEGKATILNLHCQTQFRDIKRNFVLPILQDEHRIMSAATSHIRLIIAGRIMSDTDTLTDAAIWPNSTLYVDVDYPYRAALVLQIHDQLLRIEPYGKVAAQVDDFVRTVLPRRVIEVLHQVSIWMHADRKHGDQFDPYFSHFLVDAKERKLEIRNESRVEREARAQNGVEITWNESRINVGNPR